MLMLFKLQSWQLSFGVSMESIIQAGLDDGKHFFIVAPE